MTGRASNQETRLFWQIAGELRHAIQNNDGSAETSCEIAYLIEEAEVMLQNTDSEAIRKRCRKLLAEVGAPSTGTAG